MSKPIIPVLLLTGYLGSGKTTLVNKILSNKRGIKFAVVVNDIGEVNIDADLIQKGGIVDQNDDSLVALQNGCICCTLKMDLVKQLHDIVAMQRFDYIVIEASGICEPAPIAQTICSIPSLDDRFVRDGLPVLDNIVTVVDALRMRDEFAEGKSLMRTGLDEDDIENLVIQQIEFCNMILLNKASEVSKEELTRIRKIIEEIQPKAQIIETDYCDIDLDRIVGTGMFDFDEVAARQRVAGDARLVHLLDVDAVLLSPHLVAHLVVALVFAVEEDIDGCAEGRVSHAEAAREFEGQHVAQKRLVAVVVDERPLLGLCR